MGEPNIAAHLSVVADADDETRREVARHADRIRLALATLDDGVAPTTGADEIEDVDHSALAELFNNPRVQPDRVMGWEQIIF